ncbi:hypothetical protein FLP41_05490 [Paracoccus marcusii]|uniref:hypothetical protein n=1 Tax=Paracoccus marcusii TaxID=59779 RepID=UPI002ED2E2D4|nr:hypothetical protein FLP41_05490 [Paracoccus marcusii]
MVQLRMADLVQHDITLDQIAATIAAAAAPTPAGDVASGISRVRTGPRRAPRTGVGAGPDRAARRGAADHR